MAVDVVLVIVLISAVPQLCSFLFGQKAMTYGRDICH